MTHTGFVKYSLVYLFYTDRSINAGAAISLGDKGVGRRVDWVERVGGEPAGWSVSG